MHRKGSLKDNQGNELSPLTSTLTDLIYEFKDNSIVDKPAEDTEHHARLIPTQSVRKSRSRTRQNHKRRLSTHAKVSQTAVGLRQLAKEIGETAMSWPTTPKNVMIVSKISDNSIILFTITIAKWLLGIGMNVYIQDSVHECYHKLLTKNDSTPRESEDLFAQFKYWNADKTDELHEIDFIITLGGDGTVLFASWLFQQKVPPLIPFNMGSLGFLTVFDQDKIQETIQDVLNHEQPMRMNFRMRFSCIVHRAVDEQTGLRQDDHEQSFQVLNDVVVDRGPSPFLSLLELFGNKAHLTTVQADGLVIATPTGSTAYSLSAGGSVVHPTVSAILVTPICPHTLSFRPMILPDTMDIRILVPKNSRATAWVSFDGRHRIELKAGDFIQILSSHYPVPTLCKVDQSVDWFDGLESCLAWNKREKQQPLDCSIE